jgi:hypothetical protein
MDVVSELTGHEPQALVDFLRRHSESYQHCYALNGFRALPADLRRELQEGQPEATSARIVEASGAPSPDRR